jgi:hypothetical protein
MEATAATARRTPGHAPELAWAAVAAFLCGLPSSASVTLQGIRMHAWRLPDEVERQPAPEGEP